MDDAAISSETYTYVVTSLDRLHNESEASKSSIEKAVGLGITKGYENGTFRPQAEVTRAQFITLLMRAFKEETSETAALNYKDKNDIPVWAAEAIKGALAAGYINGYEDGTFRPNAPVTRSEITALIVRMAGLKPVQDAQITFVDGEHAPDWARGYIAAAVNAGLIKGRSGNRFAPNDTATRAEAVALILALLDYNKQN